MDPNATFTRLLEALAERDLAEANAAYDDLTQWLAGGGFMPDALTFSLTYLQNLGTKLRR